MGTGPKFLRTQARAIIIRNYFEPNEQATLWALTGHDAQPTETAGLNIQYTDREAVERGREGRFRIGVVTAYNYTCALTGYRLVTLSSGTIVDACHIHQFANSRNNDLNNGISLSKNAHCLFDKGLWSLRDDYSVVVAERHFAEAGDSTILLSHMKNKKVTLPADPGQWPALASRMSRLWRQGQLRSVPRGCPGFSDDNLLKSTQQGFPNS